MKREANCVVLLQLIGVVASVAKILFSLSFFIFGLFIQQEKKIEKKKLEGSF